LSFLMYLHKQGFTDAKQAANAADLTINYCFCKQNI